MNESNVRIKIFDSSFMNTEAMGNNYPGAMPKYFRWDKNPANVSKDDIVFFTDNKLRLIEDGKYRGKINIAMLLEPRVILPDIYKYIEQNYNRFDYVLTHHKYLLRVQQFLNIDKRFIYYPCGGCWIKPEDRKIYQKIKNISIIVSKKKNTIGQVLRHDIVKLFGNKIDLVCGTGYKKISDKLEALKDYRYSIVVENCKEDGYFTEKLIDCFVTGTIPIYYGCPGNFISFDSLEDLGLILNNCNEENYNKNISVVESNFNEAQKYVCIEDWLYENFLNKLININ